MGEQLIGIIACVYLAFQGWANQKCARGERVHLVTDVKRFYQYAMDLATPPAPSRVIPGDVFIEAFAPTPTLPVPGSSSLLRSDNMGIMVAIATMMLISLISFLWFLKKATIIGGAKAPTRADPSFSFVSSFVRLFTAKIAGLEGELAAQAAAFKARLIEQAANAAATTSAAVAAAVNAANLAADAAKSAAVTAAVNAANLVAAAAASEAADENIGLLARVHELAAELNGAYGQINALSAANTAADDKLGRLQVLHDALQASYSQVSRERSSLQQEANWLRRQGGAAGFAPGFTPQQQHQQHQQQFGGFRPQLQGQPPQQQQPPSGPRGGGAYSANPGAAFGQFPRRQ